MVEITRLPYIGSDHFPLFTRLVLATSAEQQEHNQPTAEEIAEARSITADGEVTVGSVPDPGR